MTDDWRKGLSEADLEFLEEQAKKIEALCKQQKEDFRKMGHAYRKGKREFSGTPNWQKLLDSTHTTEQEAEAFIAFAEGKMPFSEIEKIALNKICRRFGIDISNIDSEMDDE